MSLEKYEQKGPRFPCRVCGVSYPTPEQAAECERSGSVTRTYEQEQKVRIFLEDELMYVTIRDLLPPSTEGGEPGVRIVLPDEVVRRKGIPSETQIFSITDLQELEDRAFSR